MVRMVGLSLVGDHRREGERSEVQSTHFSRHPCKLLRVSLSLRRITADKVGFAGSRNAAFTDSEEQRDAYIQASFVRRRCPVDQSVHRVHDRRSIRPGQHQLGQSSEPKIEEEVLSDVASDGKQLGRIGDALIVVLAHIHPRTPDEAKAIDALKDMLEKIADVKEKYQRAALRPRNVQQT
jgi:hypothetical protein